MAFNSMNPVYQMHPGQEIAGLSSQAYDQAPPAAPARAAHVNIAGNRHGSLLANLPIGPEGPFAAPDVRRMIQYRTTETMGLGVFAAEDIPQGTRILVEVPLFTLPTDQEAPRPAPFPGGNDPRPAYDKDIDFFVRQIVQVGVGDDRFSNMEELYYPEDEVPDDEQTYDSVYESLVHEYYATPAADHGRMVKLWGDAHKGYPPPSMHLPPTMTNDEYVAQSMKRLARRYTRLVAIWRANSVSVATAPADVEFAIFQIASRFNHSCTPNASRAWGKIGGYASRPRGPVDVLEKKDPYMALTVQTIRDVPKGEQIFLAYGDFTFLLPEVRNRYLLLYGVYYCGCRLCTSPVVAALQARTWLLWHAAYHWVQPFPICEKMKKKIGLELAKDVFEALMMAEETINLLTHPSWDVRTRSLANAYMVASRLCEEIATNAEELKLSLEDAMKYWQKSRMYSGKKVQVNITLEGTDGTEARKADRQNTDLGKRREKWIQSKRELDEAAAVQF